MSWNEKTYNLRSSCPLIVHNGQTADPLNRFSKLLKEVSSKRTKTEADYVEMARIEFAAGLYMGPAGPVIPASNIESMLVAAAKKFKEGPQAKAGMWVKDNAYLIYDGPTDPEKLFEDDRYRDTRAVAVQRNRVMRTRPIFHEWTATVTVMFEDSVLNGARLDEWMRTGGNLVGLCEMRPRYGRFEVV